MSAHPRSRRPRRRTAALVVLALALLAGAGLSGALAGAAPRHAVAAAKKRPKTLHIGTARNATLGRTILVTSSGRTLYTLSAETHGKFICKDAGCLAVWKPLALKAGIKPTGVAHLGAIRRPDGRRQATFGGRPLYTFTQDKRKGDANGEGFKDVGTWHAAPAPKKAAKKAQPPAVPAPSMPGY